MNFVNKKNFFFISEEKKNDLYFIPLKLLTLIATWVDVTGGTLFFLLFRRIELIWHGMNEVVAFVEWKYLMRNMETE